jgi:hypothetical protein
VTEAADTLKQVSEVLVGQRHDCLIEGLFQAHNEAARKQKLDQQADKAKYISNSIHSRSLISRRPNVPL